jgi:hypothetical protein
LLWFVNYIVAVINDNNILRDCFELYLSFVAGILDSVKDINIYVVCNEKLNYADYIEQCISEKIALFRIQESISSYHLVEKQGIYHLKQKSYMKSYRPH